MNPGRRGDWRLVGAILLAAHCGLGLAATFSDSSVADEHPHLLSGWLYWQSGRFSGGLDNPPLAQLVLSAPLRLLRLDYRFPSDEHLWLVRLPVLAATLALGLLLGRWGWTLGGPGVALAVLLALCLEPNLLAHGHLATLDLPLTLAWWGALWFWRGYLRSEVAGAASRAQPGDVPPGRFAAAALFAAVLPLAVFTKFTGFLLLPACWLVGMLVLSGRGARLRATGILLVSVAALVASAHVVFAFEPARYGLPEHLVAALSGKLAHRAEGHVAYLAGRTSLQGFPEYYVVALLMKTPLPLLVLAAAGLVVVWRRPDRIDAALLCLPALLLVAVFSWIGVQIGVRHVLAVYPAFVLLAGCGMQRLWRLGGLWRTGVAVLLILWMLGFGRVVPQFLAYFNCLAGGPRGGDRWLLDSNLDWGQDDERLNRFLARSSRRGEAWEVNPPLETARPGRFAVNANTLHNLLRRDQEPYTWLRGLRPAGYAGYSWRLYALDLDDFAARASRAPADVEAQIAHAEALAWSGATVEAGAVFERLARAAGAPPRLFRSAARVALAAGEPASAESWIRRGFETHPGDRELAKLRERARLEAAPDSTRSWVEALQLGILWIERGEADKAVPQLERARQAVEPQALRALGTAWLRLGRFEDAMQVFERIPRLAATELALTRRLLGAEAALRELETAPPSVGAPPGVAQPPAVDAPAAVAAPATVAALLEFAGACFTARHYDRAAAALIEVLREDPTHGQALALLCEMHVRTKLRLVPEPLTPRRVGRSTAPVQRHRGAGQWGE